MADGKVRCRLCSTPTRECAASADSRSFVWMCCVWKSVRSLFFKVPCHPTSRLYLYLFNYSRHDSASRLLRAGKCLPPACNQMKKKRLIPSKYRAMSHMIHPLSLLSHNLSHCVTGHPTMTQHIQLYCLQALHNDSVSSGTDGPKIRLLIGDIHWFYSISRR